MRVPENIRKCVAYIGYWNQQSGEFDAVGSVFFVGRDSGGGKASHVYAVTAKHVIDGLKSKGVQEVAIRLNMKAADASEVIKSRITDWFACPDDGSDVAILSVRVPETADHLVLPTNMFLNNDVIKEHEVSLGDEIFMTGLFRHHIGKGKNIPIIRVGNLAAMDDEKVRTEGFGEIDAYLIEARSIGGLSGSPVFLNLGFTRSIEGNVKFFNSSDPMFFFLGLIHGHYDASGDQVDAGNALSSGQINTGIAIVTPYYSLQRAMAAFEKDHST